MTTSIQIRVNGEDQAVPSGSTVADLVRSLGLTPEQVAVERNAELVPRARHVETTLAAGDALEIVTLVGGG